MTTDLEREPHLDSMTIRELLIELARVEDRLNGQRAAAGHRETAETARLQRRMRAISAHLRDRRRDHGDADPTPHADEADLIEQSIPVHVDAEEEYPRTT